MTLSLQRVSPMVYTHLVYLTPCSTFPPEKLPVPQLLKKFPAFNGTQSFILAFTRARHLSLSRARSIQSMPPFHFSKIHFNIILRSMSGSSNSIHYASHAKYLSHPSNPTRSCTLNSDTGDKYIMNFYFVPISPSSVPVSSWVQILYSVPLSQSQESTSGFIFKTQKRKNIFTLFIHLLVVINDTPEARKSTPPRHRVIQTSDIQSVV
jgi:hypothetical protein